MKPYDQEQDQLDILHNPNRDRGHAVLRGLASGDAEYAEPLALYLAKGGDIHWRNAANAVARLDPERPEFEECRELVAAIRCTLANADNSGLLYLLNM
tara:strand:+ start:655 stop:948 length:294 start_codon:yes stop_codon:yes gene_type:complete